MDVANDTGYEVYRKPGICTVGGTWSLVGTLAKDVVSFANTSLPAKTAFSYKVRSMTKTVAPSSYGYSMYSACKAATTP